MAFTEKMPLLQKHLSSALQEWEFKNDEVSLIVTPSQICTILSTLKVHEAFLCTQLIDVCAVDYLGKRTPRFEIVYHLLSLVHNERLRIKAPLADGETIPSATSVFWCADWWEREAFDMYGIVFKGHPNLRRILTDYEFEGFPLRKDFPLTGYVEVRYDETLKKVVSEPVTLPQAFRTFDMLTPWQGCQDMVSSDTTQAK